jgi:hypothetical protein
MTWFKVDDGLFSSRKVLMMPRSIRNQCMGVWVQAGSWSSKELTDGHVPGYVLEELGGIPELRDELIRVGLWLSDGADGIIFHDWCDYQPTKDKVVEERAKHADRQRKWSEKKSAITQLSDATTDSVSDTISDSAPTRPDPTRPSTSKEVDKGSASRIPTDFQITEPMMIWFSTSGLTIDVLVETENFKDYWLGKAGKEAETVSYTHLRAHETG